MAVLAMWFQDASTGSGFSGDSAHWMVIWMGVIALSLAALALVVVVGGLIAGLAMMRVIRDVKGTVDEVRRDVKTSTEEIKSKMYPLVEGITHISATAENMIKKAEGVLEEATPKIRIITDHLVETSRTLRDSAEKVSQTVGDANAKTQRQVARVDGMVTAALNTGAEVVHAVEHGIKVPAQKIAVAATEARMVVEGILDKLKGMASGLPFMQRKGEKIPASPAGYRPPVQRAGSGTTATAAPVTGPVPLVK